MSQTTNNHAGNAVIAEYQKYYDELVGLIKGKTKSSTTNSDCGHNAMVFVAMLNETDSVDMLCGEMSSLRTSLYEHLYDDLIREGKAEGTTREASDWAKNQMSEALDNFVARENSILNVYVADYSPQLLDQFINPRAMKRGIENCKINIYPVPEDFSAKESLPHISKGDRILVRVENDKRQHSASVLVNPKKDLYKPLEETFNYMTQRCSPHRIDSLS